MSSFSKYFISFTVFLLPFQTVYFLREPLIGGEKWQCGTIGIYATDILILVSLLLVWLHERNQKKLDSDISHPSLPKAHDPASAGLRLPSNRGAGKVRLSNILIVLAFLWAGLSIFWAADAWLAGYMAVKLFLAGGVFVLIREMVRDGGRKWIVWTVIASTLLQAIIGIGQFVTQETFSSTLLGISTHESWAAGTSVLKNESGRWLRAYGTLPHPNMYGLFLAVGLFLAMKRLFRAPFDTGKYTNSILLVSIPILLLGLLLSFSRLAWMGFVLGLLVLVGYQIWRGVRSERSFLQAPILILVLSGVIFIGLLHETVFPRFDDTTIAREGSITDRKTSFDEGWGMIREHPWLGVGAGNYTKNLIDNHPDRPVWDIQPAHSVSLIILAELGIIGFLLIVFLIASSFKYFSNDLFISISLVLLPSLLLDHFLWTSHFGIVFLAYLLGYAVSVEGNGKTESVRNCNKKVEQK